MPTLSADAHEKYMSDAVAADPTARGAEKKLPSAAPAPGASSAARHPGAVGTHGTHKGESTMAHMAKTANIMARNRYLFPLHHTTPHHTTPHHTALTTIHAL
jgi:hypothetical protein